MFWWLIELGWLTENGTKQTKGGIQRGLLLHAAAAWKDPCSKERRALYAVLSARSYISKRRRLGFQQQEASLNLAFCLVNILCIYQFANNFKMPLVINDLWRRQEILSLHGLAMAQTQNESERGRWSSRSNACYAEHGSITEKSRTERVKLNEPLNHRRIHRTPLLKLHEMLSV